MEFWDIYDANKERTGRTMKRNDWILQDGEYHLTVLGVVKRTDGHRAAGKYPAVLRRLVRILKMRYVVKYWKRQDLMWQMPMAVMCLLIKEKIREKGTTIL